MENREEFVQKLNTLRDELKVQSHLFEMETKQQWEALEKKWDQLNQELQPTKDAVEETSGNVKAAAEVLIEELKSGYQKIKSSLQ